MTTDTAAAPNVPDLHPPTQDRGPRRASRRVHLLADAARAPEYAPFRKLLPIVRRLGGCSAAVTRWGNRGLRARAWYSTVSDIPDAEIVLALAGRQWVGVGAPKSGLVDRLSIDLDAHGQDAESVAACHERYRRLLVALEPDHPPVVFQTPRGGLRVWLRVPPMPEASLKCRGGQLHQLLTDAGLNVAKGSLELYPSSRFIDRLPFGPRMPLLDPDSLEECIPAAAPVANARELRVRSPELLDRLERVLALLERWFDAPCEKLTERLSRTSVTIHETQAQSPTSAGVSRTVSTQGTLTEADTIGSRHGRRGAGSRHVETRLLGGLKGPQSRYRFEFDAMKLFASDPAAAGRMGLPQCDGSETSIATVTASLVARRNNGWSNEWSESVEQHGTAAEDSWRERYLTQGVVKRAMSVARREARRVGKSTFEGESRQPLAEKDWCWLVSELASASDDEPPGANRFRREVWAMSLLTAVRWQILRGHASDCPDASLFPRGFTGDPDKWVQVALPSKWMERWPGGSAYRKHLTALSAAGLLVRFAPANAFDSWTDKLRLSPGECLPAHEFLAPRPTMTPCTSLDGKLLHEAAEALSVSGATHSERGRDGRGWDPLEVQHLLALRNLNPGEDGRLQWYRRYGKSGYRFRDIAERAYQIAARVVERRASASASLTASAVSDLPRRSEGDRCHPV